MKIDHLKTVLSELNELKSTDLYSEFVFERNVEFVHKQDDKLIRGGLSLLSREFSEEGDKISVMRVKELLKEIKLSMIKAEEFQKPFQDKANLSNKDMLRFYKVFHHFFCESDYKEALKIISVLTFLNPESSAFWRARAYTFIELGDVRSALENFMAASLSNSTDVKNHLGVLMCLRSLEFIDEMHAYYKNAKEVMLDLSLVDAASKLDKQMKPSKKT